MYFFYYLKLKCKKLEKIGKTAHFLFHKTVFHVNIWDNNVVEGEHMKISQIENFVAVIDSGSINRAAEKLYSSQPAISRSIQMLEAEVGTRLIERTNLGIYPTPEGEMFYFYGKSILKQVSTLKQVKDLNRDSNYSKLCLSINSLFIRDDLILDAYQQLKSKHTELLIYETNAEQVLLDVIQAKSEVGIMILNDVQLKILNSKAEREGVRVEVIDESPAYIHLNNNLFKDQHEDIALESLKELTVIHFPQDLFSNLNSSVQIDGHNLNDFEKTLAMNNYHSMLSMLKQTDSFMLGHKWQIEVLKRLNVKSLKLKNSPLHKYFILIMKKDKVLSKEVRILLDRVFDYYHIEGYAQKL